MTRAAVYREAGGYSEDFPLNYNDVDYGLKLREKGYRIVYTPYAELFHYESVSKEGAGGCGRASWRSFTGSGETSISWILTTIRIFRRITRIITARIKETVKKAGRATGQRRLGGWLTPSPSSAWSCGPFFVGVSPAVIRVPRHLPRDSCLDGESGINHPHPRPGVRQLPPGYDVASFDYDNLGHLGFTSQNRQTTRNGVEVRRWLKCHTLLNHADIIRRAEGA